MKFFLLIAALLFQAPAPRGSVTGVVSVSGTSTPIVDAEVMIVTSDGLLETSTDAAGKFTIANVPAGRQTVLVRADGFFVESTTPNTPFAARAEVPVIVTAGAAPVAMPAVSMVRGGTVSGRVVDPQGTPLPFVRVQALRPEAGTLNSGLVPDFGNRMTDDRGEYRMFFVPPGEYVIRAQVQGGPAGPSSRPGEIQRLVATLFPNTTDIAQASRVTVKSGEEIRGIDISVKMELVTLPPPAPKPTGGHKITGVVVDAAQPWVGTASLMLVSETDAAPPRIVGSVIVGGTPGAFEIPAIQPGNYELFASLGAPNGSPGPGGGGTQSWGRTLVQVGQQDVENVRVTIRASVDVSGVVKIDGKAVADPGTLKVGLSPTGNASRLANYRGVLDRPQTPDANGKITIPRAAEGNYQVFLQGGENVYIADVRQGDKSVLNTGVEVRNAAAGSFEVLLASDGGSVEGLVSNRDKAAVGGATVLLVPADKQLFQQYRTVTAVADGKYSFRGVRPGDYKVLAGSGPLPAGGLTPELFSRIEPNAVSITVKVGSTAKTDVTVP